MNEPKKTRPDSDTGWIWMLVELIGLIGFSALLKKLRWFR
jgi:hypothetical protein